MDKRELKIDYFVCRNSVPACYEELSEKALAAAGKAYPSGLCAERTALFYAGAAYPDVPVKALAIAACFKGRPRKEVVSPCGACRQVMAEVIRRYGRDFDVLMIGEEETVVIKASSLLPFSFEYTG